MNEFLNTTDVDDELKAIELRNAVPFGGENDLMMGVTEPVMIQALGWTGSIETTLSGPWMEEGKPRPPGQPEPDPVPPEPGPPVFF
jgi:hypothetical protein